jgi:signal transduction histidine kinase
VVDDLWDERLRPRSIAFDVAVAAVFGLLTLLTAFALGIGAVLAAAAMTVAVLLRRLSVPGSVAFAALSGVAQLIGGELQVVSDLGYAFVFFALGAHPVSWVRRAGLGAVGVTVLVAGVAAWTGWVEQIGAGSRSVFTAVATAALAAIVAGGGYAAGLVRWQGRARISAQVQAGLAEERTRIAADMHDLVAHTWAVVAAQAAGARYALAGPDGERKAADALDVIAETARGSIGELRELLAELRYEQPPTPPGQAAREALLERVRASGMRLEVVEHGEPAPTPATHRLLAESLTNALKHGDLSHPVEVEEDWRDSYRLEVRNRVHDVPSPGPVDGPGHGLDGMRDRVERAGGRFEAGPVDGGWRTLAELPR